MSGPNDVVLVAGNWRVTRAEYADRLARASTELRDLGEGYFIVEDHAAPAFAIQAGDNPATNGTVHELPPLARQRR